MKKKEREDKEIKMKSTVSTLLLTSKLLESDSPRLQSARSLGTCGLDKCGFLSEELYLWEHRDTPQTHETTGAVDSPMRIQGEREIERQIKRRNKELAWAGGPTLRPKPSPEAKKSGPLAAAESSPREKGPEVPSGGRDVDCRSDSLRVSQPEEFVMRGTDPSCG